MSRSRREFTAKIKVAAFQRSGGRCEMCSASLIPGKIEYHHLIPCALGGDASLDNAVCACKACHAVSTATVDIPAVAKAKRRQAAHAGAQQASARPIKSAGFPTIAKRNVHPMPALPPRVLFRAAP